VKVVVHVRQLKVRVFSLKKNLEIKAYDGTQEPRARGGIPSWIGSIKDGTCDNVTRL